MTDWLLLMLNRVFELSVPALLVAAAGLGLAFWARRRVDAALVRAAGVIPRRPTTGAEAAAEILEATGLDRVAIEPGRGPFADHYDRADRTLRLSPAVHDGQSLAALALAAHEAGHALQHARRDPPLPLIVRDGLLQASRLTPIVAGMLAVVGFVLDIPGLTHLGLIGLGLGLALPLLGLSIEGDASRRARRALSMTALVESGHAGALADALDAATLRDLADALPRLRPPPWRRLPHPDGPQADRPPGPAPASAD